MKRALAIQVKHLNRYDPKRPEFLVQDGGSSTDPNHAQRFGTLIEVSRRLHDIYTCHASDVGCTQFPYYDVVEMVYDRLFRPEDDEVLDHTKLVWRYHDGREFPVGENRTRCKLVRPRESWSWRLAR